jgi:hypothetical protein
MAVLTKSSLDRNTLRVGELSKENSEIVEVTFSIQNVSSV